jgi:type VI secretion system protein ImpA
LLVGLSDDAPCGDDLEYDVAFVALETEVAGKPEQQMGDSINEAEPPNWAAVSKDAIALLDRSRDLRVAVFLVEAFVNLNDLGAVHDSLRLIRGFLEQFWEPVHPQLDPDDDNDPTQRLNILNSLCDFERILQPLSHIPLAQSRGLGSFGLHDFHVASGNAQALDGAKAASLSEIDGAFRSADSDQLQATFDAAGGSIDELKKIEAAFTEQLSAQDSPTLAPLRSVLQEIHHLLAQQVGDESIEEGEFDGEEPSGNGGVPARGGTIQGSQDVIRVLDQVCNYYRKHEPSSPIPILLMRAKNLVSKDFMEIVKDLAPDGVSQIETFQCRDENEDNY